MILAQHAIVRFICVATISLLLAAGPLAAAPVDLSQRTVPLRIEEDITAVRSSDLISLASELMTTVTLSQEEVGLGYGLLVPAAGIESRLEINGRRLDIDAVLRSDGALFHIPAGALHIGDNLLTIFREDAVSDSWKGTVMFSLDGTVEEAHFGLVFRDDKLDPRVGPPAHADQAKYDVLSYDCSWRPSTISSSLLAASVTMVAKSLNSTLQNVVLDFDRNDGALTVASADTGPGTPTLPFTTNGATNHLTITLPATVPAGNNFTVRVIYSGTPRQTYSGGLTTTYRRGTHGPQNFPVVYTASQPYGARRWWPCKDLPDDKATTTTQRITVPANYEVVANGLVTSKTTNPDSSVTWVWENSYPIPTYLIAFATSNYVYSEATYTALDNTTTMAISHAIYPENVPYEGNGAQGTLQVLNFFAQTFGEYPFLREKYGTVTWNIGFGIEHQTCTGMPGANSGSNTGASVGNGFTRRNIHELAHHWYGNSVTYHTFDHVWLGEGFATYAEALWDEYALGKNAYHSLVNSWTYSTSTPIVSPNADAYAGSVTYRRAALVLHMLRRVLGDEDFFGSLRRFVRPAPEGKGYSTALSSDFQAAAETVSGRNLAPFFNQWLYRPNGDGPAIPGYAFSASSAPADGGHSVTFQINQTQGGAVPFTMPLEFLVADSDGNSRLVKVENNTFSQTITVPTGTTLPLELTFDPENWILNNYSVSIRTCGLPPAHQGQGYSTTLKASGSTSGYIWSVNGSLPPGLLLTSSGILSGTPTTPGVYQIPLTVSGGGSARATTLRLEVITPPPPPPVVINEIFYDPVGGTDSGEYIELHNLSDSPVDISGCKLYLVSGANGESYGPFGSAPIEIPANTIIPASGYYVIGNTFTVGNVVNLNVSLDNVLRNGAPDAVILHSPSGILIDGVTYEADATFGGSSGLRTDALSHGGTGSVVSTTLGAADNASLARLPNGVDTGNNLRDFANAPPTPGAPNVASVSLPFHDSFDPAPSPAWRKGYAAVRSVDPGGSKPPASPAGGRMLEVVDPSGGGDVAYLAGAYDRISLECYLWLPALANPGCSIGIGVATRNESTWFSNLTGNAIENGFYLEYQNGPLGGNLKGGALPAASASGSLRLIAVDGTTSIDTGQTSQATITVVATAPQGKISPGAWNHVRLVFDKPANLLQAYLGNSTAPFSSGPIPLGGFNTSGGIVVGFREEHTGPPTQSEATWVDDLRVTFDTPTVTTADDWAVYE